MKQSLLTCALLITCFGLTVVESGEPTDDSKSFKDSLESFLSSLFGYGDNTTQSSTDTSTAFATDAVTTPDGGVTTTEAPASVSSNATNTNSSTGSNLAVLNNGTIANSTPLGQESNLSAIPAQNKSAIANTSQTDNVGTNKTGSNDTAANLTTTTSKVSSTTTPISTSTFSGFETSSYSSYITNSEEYSAFGDSKCYEDTVIQKYCSAAGDLTDVSFWDLYSAVYSDSVLDGLMMGCAKGSWCLKDKYDYWDALIAERVDIVMNSQIISSMCQPGLITCIDNMADYFKNCSFYYQMHFTSESLDLVCKLRSNNMLTAACYKHTIEALHVTLADLVRDASQPQDYVVSNSEETCESPQAHMTKGLICVANSCPGEADTFKSFRPWLWFTEVVDDLITECDYNITKCIGLLQKPAGYVSPEDLQMMITVSTATMVTAIFLSLTVCVCYRRYRRNAVIKDGYQQLLNEADES